MPPSTLIYFTNSFPYGHGENWKYIELKHLQKKFDSVTIVPLSYSGNKKARNIPDKVKLLNPILETDSHQINSLSALKFILLNPRIILGILPEVFLLKSISDLKKLLSDSIQANKILKSPGFTKKISPLLENATLYFFWGKGFADILPFLKSTSFKFAIVRVHGFDLYLERNNGYIPLQKIILNRSKHILTVSKQGTNYLTNQYPYLTKKIKLSILGTVAQGQAKPSKNNTLHLVSCSYIHPIKRINLIIKALQNIHHINIHWTHIGGGKELNDLKKQALVLADNITVSFTGSVRSEEISTIYSNGTFDLFINVSESEGLAVSIMEAMAHGIPVLATDVGGTGEIVSKKTGILLPKNPNPIIIANKIICFFNLPDEQKSGKINASIKLFHKKLNANKNAEQLAIFLKQSSSLIQ